MCFRYTCSNGADTIFRNKFHRNACARIDILHIENQLRQIFDGINIMMRRRRNKLDALNRMPRSRNDSIYFMTGELPALAGFCTLCNLNLNFICIDQIVCRDAKTSRSNLFDGAPAEISVGIRLESFFILAAFTGIRPATHAVHRNSECFMRFFTNGAVRHCSCDKSFNDFLYRFHFFNRNSTRSFFEFHQSA